VGGTGASADPCGNGTGDRAGALSVDLAFTVVFIVVVVLRMIAFSL
jgi:hypothetical protein